ncbi:hypothetical protein ACTXKY_05370 [Corynebacterium variabile]|uniref:hypothetical protein n=1 Tax=Corynebacterium variabile TaxID=1727 RepID=UPI003FD1C624
MDGIQHATMNDGWEGPESDEWADNLTITETFDRDDTVNWTGPRKRPTAPVTDPWAAETPIEEFIDYLTGTSSAPPVITTSRSDMDPWE